ncbi:LytR/AlgR family response regulator transcription factor [Allosphingosinicella indica]|uniref:Two component transcriptional regulator, LytTR family n=1 Tax=Allosphingosinicella indica TaxID=941907 RepID=A0A1X7GKK4_9SPHN|nr:LytTR family DNA-binding domain-containing protein [Allosphingosinicella indica]SMF71109.1 two component transcriptional regulator, LytTR family [Allosphingosinicella indica]
MIRAAIVEDVPLARDRLRRMLAAHRDIRIVGAAPSLAAARDMLRSAEPDLVFLDVQLPDGEGPELLYPMPPAARPLIIFLTARADYALPAFDLEAVDYLLKPAGETELARALDRVRARIRPDAPEPDPAETHIAVRDGRRTDLVPLAEIDYVDVAGHYLCLHAGRDVHLIREPIAALADRLAPAGFLRCHRSALVRTGAIVALVDRRNGDADLTLASGAVVPLSRTYRPALEAALAAAKR